MTFPPPLVSRSVMTHVCPATACPSEAPPKQGELVGDVKTPAGNFEPTEAGFLFVCLLLFCFCDRPLLSGRVINKRCNDLTVAISWMKVKMKNSFSQHIQF